MVADDHVLQQQHILILIRDARAARGLAHLRHPAHQMAQQQTLNRIVVHIARIIALHLSDLAQVMGNNTRAQKIGVQPGIYLQHLPRALEHGGGMVQ